MHPGYDYLVRRYAVAYLSATRHGGLGSQSYRLGCIASRQLRGVGHLYPYDALCDRKSTPPRADRSVLYRDAEGHLRFDPVFIRAVARTVRRLAPAFMADPGVSSLPDFLVGTRFDDARR